MKENLNIGDIVLPGDNCDWKQAKVIGVHHRWSDVLILEDFDTGKKISELRSKMKKRSEESCVDYTNKKRGK